MFYFYICSHDDISLQTEDIIFYAGHLGSAADPAEYGLRADDRGTADCILFDVLHFYEALSYEGSLYKYTGETRRNKRNR